MMSTAQAEQTRCATCYDAAEKAGRTVRLTTLYPWPVCTQCERHLRNGLAYYHPSNGTEYRIFEERCEHCRHHIDDGQSCPSLKKPAMCAWGVLDRLTHQMVTDRDHIDRWFDPADLQTRDEKDDCICPARCLRFTHKNEPGGEHRDPPKPDCEGQMFFSEVLTVPERVPVTSTQPQPAEAR